MKTQRLNTSETDLQTAACILKNGGLVAFPTETVYGLGANALDPKAVAKVYEAKGRPSDNPMIVHISRASDIGQLTPELSPRIIKLIENFWPGPLTLVVPKKAEVPDITTGGLDTVAVRMPDDKFALKIITLAGCPIAAPSANLSGKPSPTKASHVIDDLDGKIDAIVCGADCRVGIESTVLDVSVEVATILRPGIITAENIEAAIGEPVEFDPALFVNLQIGSPAPKSPGMKYKHYAPNAQMTIIEGQRDKVKSEIDRLKKMNEMIGLKVGVIFFEEKAFIEAAHDFFSNLRELDQQNVDLILAGALSDKDGVGFAVMNR
ncbi:MAG: threonylcarbamoyl-AMP synthase, partial [Peptostreptococcaceae bacterium]|nr:threonylcarbamoyl-AMP synthase [Peptostreptococcaceae bacterium]